jgi:C4-type Zn-finger protein
VSREFCKGALSVIDGLMHDIDALIESANVLKQQEDEEERQEKELSAVSRTPGLDGGGYGDLAS